MQQAIQCLGFVRLPGRRGEALEMRMDTVQPGGKLFGELTAQLSQCIGNGLSHTNLCCFI